MHIIAIVCIIIPNSAKYLPYYLQIINQISKTKKITIIFQFVFLIILFDILKTLITVFINDEYIKVDVIYD